MDCEIPTIENMTVQDIYVPEVEEGYIQNKTQRILRFDLDEQSLIALAEKIVVMSGMRFDTNTSDRDKISFILNELNKWQMVDDETYSSHIIPFTEQHGVKVEVLNCSVGIEDD